MYQQVIRDPGGESPVRVIYSESIVNGSVLIVPADTEAFFVCNGIVSEPYNPGRHGIFTGVGPFFVRFRNLMTRGDPGLTCQVFFVSKQKEFCEQGGTGNIIFQEKRFLISLNAKASYTLRYTIGNPRSFISKLVGMHNNSFDVEDIRPAITSMMLPVIKESIAESLSANTVHTIQNDLTGISRNVRNRINDEFLGYGINLRAIVITSINISEDEVAKLRELEAKEAKGRINTNIEADNVQRVYGNIDNRTRVEMVTGTLRGPGQLSGIRGGTAGMVGALATLPWQMEMAKAAIGQMNPNAYGQLSNGNSANETGNGTAEGHQTEENTRGRAKNTPPPIPKRSKSCKYCGRKVEPSDVYCKHCGRKM